MLRTSAEPGQQTEGRQVDEPVSDVDMPSPASVTPGQQGRRVLFSQDRRNSPGVSMTPGGVDDWEPQGTLRRPTTSQGTFSLGGHKLPSNLPKFKGSDSKSVQDPEEFLELFETICDANDVPRERWGKVMATCLTL